MQVLASFAPILWHALEKAIRCSLTEIVPFPENLGKGDVAGGRLRGEDIFHGVVSNLPWI